LRDAPHRPNLEVLEDRCVPTQYAATYLELHDATGLNNAGQVVGNAGGRAVLWDNGTAIDLGTLGGSFSHAAAINDQGQVVGTAALPGDADVHGFLITPQGGAWFRDSDLDGRNDLMVDLGTQIAPTGINNAGQVVGNSGSDAFLWDPVNGMVDLRGGDATAINEAGHVTGTAGVPFVGDAGNGITLLDPGPDYTSSSVAAINNAGQIVGYHWVNPPTENPYQIAFRWTPDTPNGITGSYSYLYDPLGLSSSASDINNIGQVVGSHTVDVGIIDTVYAERAFLWDTAGGLVDLQNQLLSSYYPVPTLENAQAINDRGAILAGSYNGWGEYLLTPIPPSTPTISIADAPAVIEGNTGTTAATFTVNLSAASARTVTVDYATADDTATAGSDYQATSGRLTFAPGETSKTITVQVIGDHVAEPNETFIVHLSSPTNAVIAGYVGEGTILDDEPKISIGDTTATEGNTGTVNATFTLTLSSASNSDVTVHYDTANMTAVAGSDYVAASRDVVIPAGQTSAAFTVQVIGDRLPEPTETFAVNLSAATNATIADGQGVGTIVDDEPRIRISDVSRKEGKKGQTTQFTFTVTLSAAYDQAVTMSYQTVNGTATTSDSDYVAKSGTLTFAPGETTKTITIVVSGDSKKESDETFYLDLFGLSSNALFTKKRGLGTILNDD
jgi:probable HAF family extracellular repeat protein